MIISVCGPIGFETAKKIYDENSGCLKERFASFFLKQFVRIGEDAVRTEPVFFDGLIYSGEIKDGGIYRALWEAGEALGCGMSVDNTAIPLRQEVVEILELFGETPYECSSAGSWLLVTEREVDVILSDGKQIPVSVIGVTDGGNARILKDNDSVRYLTPPARQEKDIEDRVRGGYQGFADT